MTDAGFDIAVVTTSRADYGIYRPVLRAMQARGDLNLSLIVSGTHLKPAHGMTVQAIEADGWTIRDRLDTLSDNDGPEGIADSMGRTTEAAAAAFGRARPDLLMVLGDRFEMHAVALAAVPFQIPIAHIHGGEETEGAIDNVFRHAISKMSHLHFCATGLARRRLLAMGEDPAHVHVTGAPGLDAFVGMQVRPREAFLAHFGLSAERPFIVMTHHPETQAADLGMAGLDALLGALEAAGLGEKFDVLITGANADTGGQAFNTRLRDFAARHQGSAVMVGTLGADYASAMRHTVLMVGNSSSGIIEAASMGLPVLNIGDRQKGRERSDNVIDVPSEPEAVREGLARSLSPAWRQACNNVTNVYGDGKAGPRIADLVAGTLGQGLRIQKTFFGVEA